MTSFLANLTSFRALMIIGMVFSVAGVVCSVLGMRCATVIDEDSKQKRRIILAGGASHLFAGNFDLMLSYSESSSSTWLKRGFIDICKMQKNI